MGWNKNNKHQGKNEKGISKKRNLPKQGKGNHKLIEIKKNI